MADEMEEKIKQMIVERCFLTIPPEDIAEDAPLIEEVGLDSVQVLEVVVGLEDEFGVQIEDADFDIENFATVEAIADYVRDREG